MAGSFVAQGAKVGGYMVSYHCSLSGELNHAGGNERNISLYGSALLEVFGGYFIASVVQSGLVQGASVRGCANMEDPEDSSSMQVGAW
jgi:hypothetical protein